MKRTLSLTIACSIALVSFLMPTEVLAKKWTVTQRIEKLSKEIDEGRKANELTTKQVDALKKMVVDITGKMDKMKVKNGGKLSIPDTKKLHDEITDLSVKIYKQRLENVYAD